MMIPVHPSADPCLLLVWCSVASWYVLHTGQLVFSAHPYSTRVYSTASIRSLCTSYTRFSFATSLPVNMTAGVNAKVAAPSPAPRQLPPRIHSNSQTRERRRSESRQPPKSVNLHDGSEPPEQQRLKKRLSHRHEIAHSPHAHKNVHIKTGYVVHRSWGDALLGMSTLHNETLNTVTSLLGLVVAAYVFNAALTHWEALGPLYRPIVLSYGVGCALNSLLVAAYHVFNSHPPLYHLMSAVDLLGISGAAAAFAGCTLLVPGASIVRGMLQMPQAHPWLASSVGVAKFPLLAVGVADAATPPWEVLYYWLLTYTVVMGVFACVRRAYTVVESPKALLLLNILPNAFICLDHCLASPLPYSWVGITALVVGAMLYALKIPERWMEYRPSERVRMIDLVGHSHMVWHISYLTTFLVCGLGTVHAALAAAAAETPSMMAT